MPPLPTPYEVDARYYTNIETEEHYGIQINGCKEGKNLAPTINHTEVCDNELTNMSSFVRKPTNRSTMCVHFLPSRLYQDRPQEAKCHRVWESFWEASDRLARELSENIEVHAECMTAL
jgi:hypothetical protein